MEYNWNLIYFSDLAVTLRSTKSRLIEVKDIHPRTPIESQSIENPLRSNHSLRFVEEPLQIAAGSNRLNPPVPRKNSFTFTRSQRDELIDMNEERPTLTKSTTMIVTPVAPVVKQPRKTKMAPITNDMFIRVWNQSEYVTDAAEALGMNPASARARAAKLRATFAKAGVELNLKKHPKAPRKQKKSLSNDLDELKRLAAIARESMPSEPETQVVSSEKSE
jgi:hypothetical protein